MSLKMLAIQIGLKLLSNYIRKQGGKTPLLDSIADAKTPSEIADALSLAVPEDAAVEIVASKLEEPARELLDVVFGFFK